MDPVCHFEVPFDDIDRASKFYNEVFGWQIMAAPGDIPYHFASTITGVRLTPSSLR